MCPDAELLSAWTDDEVPSPWKERIASHLEACRDCAAKVARFRRLSLNLRSSGKFAEAAVLARVASRLGIEGSGDRPILVASLNGANPVSRSGSPLRGHKNIALPIPLAAAAAAAFLVVGLLSGRMLAFPGASARGSASSSLAAAAERNPASTIPASLSSGNQMSGNPTMDSLVRYLETQNAPVSITIQLPSNGSFSGGGTPMIVKTPSAETVSLPPSNQGLGFVMSGSGK